MERQYIGARYVPIFFENPNTGDSTWLSGVAYEGLTIVTFAGNSYTSKKPVPAGIGAPNANPEYWVSTGNYNAQIQELRDEVGQLKQETNAELETKEVVFSERRYLFVGDSYAKLSPTNWVGVLVNTLQIPSGKYHDLSVSGTGFTSGANGADGNGFLTQLQTAVQAGYDAEDITDIVVVGGINDSKYSTGETAIASLQPAISDFCVYAHEHFPKAKIWIAYAGFASDTSSVLSGRDILKRHIAQWMYSQAHSNSNAGIVVNIDAWKILAQNKDYMGNDLLHPSEYGSTDLGNQLSHWLSGGSIYVHRFEYNYGPFRIMVDNDGIHFETLETANIPDEIPAYPTGYVYENILPFYVNKKFATFGYIQTGSSGSYAIKDIKYEIQNRTVRVIPMNLTGTGWAGYPRENKFPIDSKFTIPWEYIG